MQGHLFFWLLASLLWGFPLWAQKPSGTYYVGANAGLNLRATSSSQGEKLGTALYGEAVEIIAPAADKGMTVDGIQGGMAKVRFAGKVGYMFDGYLLSIPAPSKGEEVAIYVGRLWEAGVDVLHEEVRRDWGGYAQYTYSLYLKEIPWSEAYLIAKNLFSIPMALQYPGDNGRGEVVTKNPNAGSEAWTDELTASYEATGKLNAIVYAHRAEGGGVAISIRLAQEDGYHLKISELDIAD